MSQADWFVRGSGGTRDHVQRCEACGDVILSARATAPKTCCGQEMTPASDPPPGYDEIELEGPEHLLRSVFGIGTTAVEICFHVLEAHETTAEEIARATDLERSGVARHLKHLHELGLIDRAIKNLSDGGFIYVYSAPGPGEVQQHPQRLFLAWATDALALLDSLNRQKLDLLSGGQTWPSEAIYWTDERTQPTSPP